MTIFNELMEWRNFFDILIVACIIYILLKIFRGTIALQVLKGLAIFSVFFIIAEIFRLDTLSWIIDRLVPILLIGIIVLFQPELRRGLARIGERSFGSFFEFEGNRVIEEVCKATVELSKNRFGGLIAFERETGLDQFIETGILLNAEVTAELILALFYPKGALHDGAMIVRGNTLVAASCLFPLDRDETLRFGTRHRAALGISKETDAIIVVVSEETGDISFAHAGKLVKGISGKTLREMLTIYLNSGNQGGRA